MTNRESIGFTEAFSIGVGGMIGGGIFAVLGLSLQLAGTAAPIAFLIAGLIALATAYSYSKLSIRYPSEGGTIEYLVRAYGNGVFSGGLNIMLLASYIVMISLYSYAFGSYGASMLGGSIFAKHLLATLAIVLFTIINALGAVITGRTEDALVLFKVAILVLVVGAGFSFVDWGRMSSSNWPGPVNIIAGGMIIFLAYEGFELIANTAKDVRDIKVLPKAFISAVVFVTTIYVLVAIVTAGTLTPQQVAVARDYALAMAAKPALGELGFLLIVAAALASTSSAINATLYGTARASYIVAKYGQLPKIVEKKVWRSAYEGLILISILSVIMVNTTSLEAISAAGSGGFLTIFMMVNFAAYKLRRETGANKYITLLGGFATLFALGLLVLRMIQLAPTKLSVFITLLVLSFLIEYAIRRTTGREISKYIDPDLEKREKHIRSWHEWIHRVIKEILEEFRDAEIYIVGSIARGEIHRSHDVDVMIVSSKVPADKNERLKKKIELKTIKPYLREYPVDIHLVRPEEKDEWLKKQYKKLESKNHSE